MMSKITTIQDIAKALDLSRNTVSKALNTPEQVPEHTRKRVWDMALALNYKSMAKASENSFAKLLNYLLICKENRLSSSFFVPLIQKLHERVRINQATLTTQFVSTNDVEHLNMPLRMEAYDGIIMLDLLNEAYIRQVLSINKPTVFFDFIADFNRISGNYDIVMEQSEGTYRVTSRLIEQGARKIGFVGDINHCLGFRERYLYYRAAMIDHHLEVSEDNLLISYEKAQHSDMDFMLNFLRKAPLPDAFVCANDYAAIWVMEALKKMQIKIPDQVAVSGYDNVSNCEMHSPTITSVKVDQEALATGLIMLLTERIRSPQLPRRILYEDVQIVTRESTKSSREL